MKGRPCFALPEGLSFPCYPKSLGARRLEMTETLFIVSNPDGDILFAVRPSDPLNPGFTEDEILTHPDLSVETIHVIGVDDFQEAMARSRDDYLPVYDLYAIDDANPGERRMMGEAQGIEAAERAVRRWLEEEEGDEIQIFLGERFVESGRMNGLVTVKWQTNGRRSDLR